MQNEMGFDPPTHPERSQEAHDEGPGGSSVVQEIFAEAQAERSNRDNESYFREQPAEQNSRPLDCCVSHFATRAPHVEPSAIVAGQPEVIHLVNAVIVHVKYWKELVRFADS